MNDSGYEAWIQGLRNGCSYVSEGLSHILEFSVEDAKLSAASREIHLKEARDI